MTTFPGIVVACAGGARARHRSASKTQPPYPGGADGVIDFEPYRKPTRREGFSVRPEVSTNYAIELTSPLSAAQSAWLLADAQALEKHLAILRARSVGDADLAKAVRANGFSNALRSTTRAPKRAHQIRGRVSQLLHNVF